MLVYRLYRAQSNARTLHQRHSLARSLSHLVQSLMGPSLLLLALSGDECSRRVIR